MNNQKFKKKCQYICNDGIVKEIYSDYLMVEMTLQSACSACHAKSVCLHSQRKDEIIKVKKDEDASFDIGEKVHIQIEQKKGTVAILYAYFFPFMVLLFGFIILNKLIYNELISALLSILLTAFYYFLLWFINRKQKIDNQFQLQAKKI
jgi:sigma-E factor negative regulatory protein RseC